MTTMITARVDSQKRKTSEMVFSEVGLTTSAKSDFDKKFDEMDAEIAEMFC